MPTPRTTRCGPKLAIARERFVQLSERRACIRRSRRWRRCGGDGELAVLQGVGYPQPNLSHFRSIEIWDTAIAERGVSAGRLAHARVRARRPCPRQFAADGVIVGSNDLGPLAGGGTRAIALADTEQFLRRARLAQPADEAPQQGARAHPASRARHRAGAQRISAPTIAFATSFRDGVRQRRPNRVPGHRQSRPAWPPCALTLGGFDTHANQAATQARLLGELAGGLVALRSALDELGRWDDTLVLTYAEFGRRPKENQTGGTDHGTANVHFALGGRVAGGLYGAAPDLARLSGDGNPAHALDFRSVYATVLERWWGVDSPAALGGRFAPVPFLAG